MAVPVLPLIDIAPLLADPDSQASAIVARQIDDACRDLGFFRVVGHGIDPALQPALEVASHSFFDRPEGAKAAIAMEHGGRAWRGWFPVGGELTSGVPDQKEGIYFGSNHSANHPRVRSGVPLHGKNLFPAEPADLEPLVESWIDQVAHVGLAILRGIARGLELAPQWFDDNLVSDPTVLFRIFHYPPGDDATWGVGEHTDYGLLTVLAQDECGGLQVRLDDDWIDVPPEQGVFVCNLGDMIERLTEGRYRSTVHRVRNTSGRSRLSFPLFLDPSWDAVVPVMPLAGSPPADDPARRWDGSSVRLWEGSYGHYLTTKVARVFPALVASMHDEPAQP
ncbi:MAG: 2-oxoglutarate and iron-dependent oxygenase domain-containing protein [Acidimicrobiales bacterium]